MLIVAMAFCRALALFNCRMPALTLAAPENVFAFVKMNVPCRSSSSCRSGDHAGERGVGVIVAGGQGSGAEENLGCRLRQRRSPSRS